MNANIVPAMIHLRCRKYSMNKPSMYASTTENQTKMADPKTPMASGRWLLNKPEISPRVANINDRIAA